MPLNISNNKTPNISSIVEGEGLGQLKFGLNRKDVELILGEPNEIEKFPDTDGNKESTESWHYDDLELSLGFYEEEDWRLVTISITSKDYKFREFTLIGLSKEQLTLKLKEENISDLEFEDWTSAEGVHELLSSETLEMNFWFEADKLLEVQWGPIFMDDETIEWPESK